MFICQIRHHIQNNVYLLGLRDAFDHLASTNPGWQYQLRQARDGEQNIHLILVDVTSAKTSSDITVALNQPRVLVLVNARQVQLMAELQDMCRCSILCVDEPYFAVYDIIEKIMRKRRYLSPMMARITGKCAFQEPVIFTPAEMSVIAYLRQGYSGVEIATRLFRSQKTISSHKRNIMKKLKTTGEVELNIYLRTMIA